MKANSYLDKHQTETKKAHPAMAELIKMSGDAVKGKWYLRIRARCVTW